jgi:subtilisin
MQYIKENIKELEITGVIECHKNNILGQGIKVAILENHLDSSLKMFKGKVKTLEYKNNKLVEYVEKSKSTSNSHAQKEIDIIFQIMPEVEQVYCLPSGFSNVGGKVEGSIFESLKFIIDNKIDIVSSSIGGVNHPKVIELIKKAKDQGTVFLNAIGNSGKESTDSFVNTGEFIDVGAAYYSDRRKEINRCSYSSTGSKLEVMEFVPDVRDARNKDRSFSISGTSFSTPMFAATIGLLKGYFKSKNKIIYQDQILDLIKNNSIDLGEKGKDDLYGYGVFILPKLEELNLNRYQNTNQKEGENMKDIKCTDIENHWAKINIQKVIAAGLMNGYEDNTFKPDNGPTRAELATILVRALNL